ncbi:MAG: rhodanese-like domain-containing protein, partial [Bacteroidetes bacterium]|nr:rhodanese-like domain-containing protein [Bacteroidota bacterium]
DNVLGYLKGGIDGWKSAGREADAIESIPAEEFSVRMKTDKLKVFDVRKPGEWDAEHLEQAHHASLQFINDHLAEFSKTEPNYIHCAGGYRSMTAASILKARGFHNVVDVAGGFAAIKKTGLPTTDFVCQAK